MFKSIYIYILLILIVLISKEFIYISDEFLVILAFLIITTLFFTKLSSILSSALDEYSQKISDNAKELVILQQKILAEARQHQVDLLNLQVRIQYLTSYILEQTSDVSDLCEDKYFILLESYLNSKLINLLLLDIEYYEKIASDIFIKEIDLLINSAVIDNVLGGDSETLSQQTIFFPFVDSAAI